MLSKFDENINFRTHRGSLNLRIFLHTKPPHVDKACIYIFAIFFALYKIYSSI
jgi:hypothetical protein